MFPSMKFPNIWPKGSEYFTLVRARFTGKYLRPLFLLLFIYNKRVFIIQDAIWLAKWNGEKFKFKFIFITIYLLYLFTLNDVFLIQEYIYSHLRDAFTDI